PPTGSLPPRKSRAAPLPPGFHLLPRRPRFLASNHRERVETGPPQGRWPPCLGTGTRVPEAEHGAAWPPSLSRSHRPLGHWTISSARASTEGGIGRTSALAVLRLIANSKVVERSIGRSPGLAPFRIRSTWLAEPRNISVMVGPQDIRAPFSPDSLSS